MKALRILIACLTIILAGTTLVAAQPLNDFSIPWWTTGGGGGTSSGAGYTLSGTVGQADAGEVTGGGYTLSGGYWDIAPGQVQPQVKIYLPVIRR